VSLALGPPLRRVLDRLGTGEEALPLEELARRLFALTATPDRTLARRLVASAVGCRDEWLPDALSPRSLPRVVEGPIARQPLEEALWIVVDLETTGLSPERSRILEIGAVRIAGLRLADRFQTLVDPCVPIPARITALTGIDRSLVADAPSLPRAMAGFRAWVGESEVVAFVAHNAAFDERFVRSALAAHALPPWSGPVFCTRRLARRLVPELPRFDLDSLAARFGIRNPARHRALGDAEATARALLELIAIACDERAAKSVGDLLVLQAERAAGRSRRSGLPHALRVG
jgi:DNA polymerase III epsilon subunit family exonuclease